MSISERILHSGLREKIISPENAAFLFQDGMVVASSGFTKAGDSKLVLQAVANRAKDDPLKITLITGASLGHQTDGALANVDAIKLRMPFQTDAVMRKSINAGEILFIDQNLGEVADLLKNGHLPKIDLAIIEASLIRSDGSIILTTSVGNSPIFANLAEKIIIEVNSSVPLSLVGLHDIFLTGNYPDYGIIPITLPGERIGADAITINPEKIVGIVLSDITDSPAENFEEDDTTISIAKHLLNFFESEVQAGRLNNSLLPIQAGIGKVANSVLKGFVNSQFSNLTMYSEVLQDSAFDLFDCGKLISASASSITVSKAYYERIFTDFEKYKSKIVLRPQDITNSPEVIRRLGVIAINTAMECDIYGNVNSSHIGGTHMMNGIGGSADFAQNSYLSIFVTPSAGKEETISRIVPMVSHVDHTEHDVDIILTEQGLADLRGLAPRERANRIIENCVHPDYKYQLSKYFSDASKKGGQTPHMLTEAFSWHESLELTGTMKTCEIMV